MHGTGCQFHQQELSHDALRLQREVGTSDLTKIRTEDAEAHAACGHYFVHELTSEVDSRMLCVTKIMAMPGTRTTVADLCMFGLASC